MAELPETAEVAVIGGGVMGVSTAYHLTRAGCSNVVLLEAETLGAGQTSRAAGGIRAQFSDELNIRIGLECIRRFERFPEEPGWNIDFKQWGYLFLLTNDLVERFRSSVALQQSLGVPSRMISPEETLEVVPGLDLNGIAAATWCPVDGYATPEAVIQGYWQAALRAGARLVQGCRVTRILVDQDRVKGVDTVHGQLSVPRVVCVAGLGTAELMSTAGVPVEAVKRWVYVTEPGDGLVHELPLTVDFATGFYFHRDGNGLLLGGPFPTLEELAPAALRRLPELDVGIRPGWYGYYVLSPDHNAIVGQTNEPEGLLYATGFSGHGFQQAPVVGEYLTDLALGRESVLDLAPFSLDRFATEDLKEELNVI